MPTLSELEKIVTKMRELGVIKFDGIEIGPKPYGMKPVPEEPEDEPVKPKMTIAELRKKALGGT